MKVPKIIEIVVFVVLVTTTSCYYDVEEELYPQVGCNISDVTYSGDIAPLISANCYPCHTANSNFGNITLEGYDQLKVQIDNGKVWGAINHQPGFSPMPQSAPKLLECQIEKIQAWVNEGALNN